ncbi:MAG: hypothetical protein LBG80_14975 [Bacteroidales bacterium]|jgi:hypothetical protein|nr:hypothetical protein [Bacteroidales bacterium]
MNNPAFIVDGYTEKRIINYFCPGQPVRLLNCNGKDVRIEAAAKRIATLIRLMKNNYPIIIIFDKEKRNNEFEEIANKLLLCINANDIQKVEILIGIPDIMIENWILADIQSINSYYSVNIAQENFEGINGKSKIRQIIKPRYYSEAEDGPELIKKCFIKNIYNNSASFKYFYEKIKVLNCEKLIIQ